MNSLVLDTPDENMTLERLKSLYELIGRMNSVYNLEELLEFVVERALNLTGGRRALLLMSDDDERKLQHIAIARGEDLAEKHKEQALNFVSTAVIKDVLDRGEPRLITDLQTDQRYEGSASLATLKFKRVRSVLAVPLKIDTQLVGLIYIDHPRQGIFGPNDLDFLSAFAIQAAMAINRAKQHHQQLSELTYLNELSRSVVQVLDLDEVLTRIVNEAIRMLNVETGSVLLLDEPTAEIFFATSVSNGLRIDIPTRLNQAEGIAGWVMAHRQPLCVNSATEDSRWFGEVDINFSTRSILCVPLEINGRVLGALQALNKKSSQGFSQTDIARLSAFAVSATIAIENARLFQEARQARQLRALNEIALALSSTLDLTTILQTGLEKSLLMLGAEAGLIGLLEPAPPADALSVRVSQGFATDPATLEQQLNPIKALALELLKSKADQALLIDHSHYRTDSFKQILATVGIEALVLTPICTGQVTSGVLAVVNAGPHTYSEEEISLLDSIARIIGLALQNALNYEQMQAQTTHLRLLNEIGGALTRSLDLATVLQVVIEGVNTLLETERTSVFLVDPDTGELVLRYTNKGHEDIRLPAPWQGIAGWVASNDQPALVNDTLSDPRYLREVAVETGFEAYSILCVPLKVEGQVIGVIEVLNKTGDQQFTPQHQALLTELTRWAAIALHNARLFDERLQAYQSLTAEQQRRITAETRAAMAAIILDMGHTMNNVIGAIRVWALHLENAAATTPQAGLIAFVDELRRIRQNAQEALKLISTMTAPLEQAALAPTDVNEGLAEAVRTCWRPDNVNLEVQYGHNLPLVQANAKRLEAVFQNLITNAIQVLTESGGLIRLSTQRSATGQVEITISDNGPGIPPELQDHVFNPGVSGKEGGLGLGLWLVEMFIHQFDGQIRFNSSAATGTTFIITLQAVENNDDSSS
jgi:GAF domain-containing protein/anti-sigma regulatory factor (Ser/Thr protein kinase)